MAATTGERVIPNLVRSETVKDLEIVAGFVILFVYLQQLLTLVTDVPNTEVRLR